MARAFFKARGHTARLAGKGPDGGRDILVKIEDLTDGISAYPRRWVVQCKFYDKTLSLTELVTVNIPSLIHRHRADGYLLICKNDVSGAVTDLFDDLRDKCRFSYHYEIWSGSQFYEELTDLPKGPIFAKHFPEYQEHLIEMEAQGKALL